MSPVASTVDNFDELIWPALTEPVSWSTYMSAMVWALKATPLWKTMPSRSIIVQTLSSSFAVIPVAALPTYAPVESCSSSVSYTARIML